MKNPLQDIFVGMNNADLDRARGRLIRGQTYRDLSTVMVMPTRGMIPSEVVQALLGLQAPMNQKFTRIFVKGAEVGDAYNQAVKMVLEHPELSRWKYLLTVEEDNCPPPDGLLRLYESIEQVDAVGGLYWTKGEGGQPMIYGDPAVMPKNFIPQVPQPNALQRCNGLGMGFTLFRLAIFKKVPAPWFRTLQGREGQCTQDLYFFGEAAKYGYKFASDNRVKVGHLDPGTGIIW